VDDSHSGRWHLVEIRVRFGLADAVEVIDIDELKVEEETGVCSSILRPQAHMGQVAEPLVAPVVQLTYTATTQSPPTLD